jgi:DNA-binding SARP family transcriptional activator
MKFGVLGPLEAFVAGAPVRVPPGRPRAVLAALLLNGNRVVSADQLAEMLWGSQPPPTARVAVQNHVKRLRDALGAVGRSQILTRPPGYMIVLGDGELDLTSFAVALESARSAARNGRWEDAAAQAVAALRLWRGEPLADIESEVLAARELPRLHEMHLLAVETRIEAGIHLGHAGDFIGELRQLVAASPLREHLHALLMSALYACGRQAEALSAFQQVRTVLVAELGAEPGLELRELQQRILAGQSGQREPAAPAPAVAPAASPARTDQDVPRELPGRVPHFLGREPELAALTGLLGQHRDQRALVISAIGGTAGVGKTALAVAWAHQVASQFPDGQLYVNLRGFDPDKPVEPAEALASFLRALGVPGRDVPADTGERARRYRSLMAGRRILVLLDNARDSAQVRPLLPGDSGCLAVVTSRDSLAGLVATDGARRLDLDVLPPAEAVALLRSLIGSRVDDDAGAAVALAALCARLPLALRIAAELAAARPAVPLTDLAAELELSRLDLLDTGEDRADVRAVFSWSFRQLPADAAAAFALIGLHPGPDLDAHATAALTATTPAQARRLLSQLSRASLIQAAGPGRYGLHDLLRSFAREQLARLAPVEEQEAALTRLFDYYRAAAAAAMDVLFPAEAELRPHVPAAAAVIPGMPAEADALAWLNRERTNLIAAAVHGADNGRLQHATDLAGTVVAYLLSGSYLAEGRTLYGRTLDAARDSGDAAAEAVSLHLLGGVVLENGGFRDAGEHFRAALGRYQECDDRFGEARILHNLGITEHLLHNYEAAADYLGAAMAAFRDLGSQRREVTTLCCLARVEADQGADEQAAGHLEQALDAARSAGYRIGEAEVLSRMGALCLRRGQLTEAAEVLREALAVYQATGQIAEQIGGLADTLAMLGDVSLRRGDYGQAIRDLEDALARFREAGYKYGEITMLRKLAEAQRAAGQLAAAKAGLTVALRLAAETGNTYEEAGVHRDLAESHHDAGVGEQARYHWQQALTLYTELGAPEAEQLRSRLEVQPARTIS